ncbi:MAG: hypothetical protein M9888_03025 [Chitinophagales bacterium]|nr:hypothetical protein [Chitinophagales bacterium]
MKNHIFLILVILFGLLLSCKKEDINKNKIHSVFKERIEGAVQKGPFINGTSISISELNANLIQTGKVFNSQISNNYGCFEMNKIELSSQYIELKADGFYFNEISNQKSSAPLTLYALSDITDKSTLNVNIFSHLEKGRVINLLQRGKSFVEAKNQAQKEILQIFSIDKANINESELLDITQGGDGNAILLAVSLIIQGYGNVADLSELLANISSDISVDGKLDNQKIGTQLINHAKLLDLEEVRKNLQNRYSDLNVDVSIPDFEKYVNSFIENTSYISTNAIEYPLIGEFGNNILHEDNNTFTDEQKYSFAAHLPQGTSLKIVLSGFMWFKDGDDTNNEAKGWQISGFDFDNLTQTYTATKEDSDIFLLFSLSNNPIVDSLGLESANVTIDYYENNDKTPTKTRVVKVVK